VNNEPNHSFWSSETEYLSVYGTMIIGAYFPSFFIRGMGNNHFELKFGGVVNPVNLLSYGYDDYAFLLFRQYQKVIITRSLTANLISEYSLVLVEFV